MSSILTIQTLGRHAFPTKLRRPLRRRAEREGVVYDGAYGPWSINEEDKREVYLYRLGLSICASSMAAGTALSFFPDSVGSQLYDPLFLAGIVGFGMSLTQVHMYAASIKRTIQALWLMGTLGAVYLATSHDTAIAINIVQHPGYVWLVGPLFAAMTGLTIKEGLCYGKAEAALLTLLIPATLLGHLSGAVSLDVLHYSMTACVAAFAVLALRKYTQPVKDDIGDKSIFTFLKMSEEEQNEVLSRMQ